MTLISFRFSAVSFFLLFFAVFAALGALASFAQLTSPSPDVSNQIPVRATSGSTIELRAVSTTTLSSERGGAFMVPAKCDGNGNLYIRKFAADRPLLGPIVRIDPDGKRSALFDPGAFSQLALNRADAFSPAPDGGLYQIAESDPMAQDGNLKRRIYVLHFSSDGSAAASVLLDADLEVYTFAAFADGNFLVSGLQRDAQNKNDRGRSFTAVLSGDGRELAQLKFQGPPSAAKIIGRADSKDPAPAAKQIRDEAEKQAPVLDLADAAVGSDGFLYVMRGASPVRVYVIASSGKIMKTIRVASPLPSGRASGFHVSANRLAISFQDEDGERAAMIIADAQTGREIARYEYSAELGPTFACYAADESEFTFLKLGEGNALDVIRAAPE
jgi:hypothetical protein